MALATGNGASETSAEEDVAWGLPHPRGTGSLWMQDDQDDLAVKSFACLFFKRFICFCFMFKSVFGLHVCLWTMCILGDPRGQEDRIGGTDVWSHNVGAGKQTGII